PLRGSPALQRRDGGTGLLTVTALFATVALICAKSARSEASRSRTERCEVAEGHPRVPRSGTDTGETVRNPAIESVPRWRSVSKPTFLKARTASRPQDDWQVRHLDHDDLLVDGRAD